MVTVTSSCPNTMIIGEESYIISPNYPRSYRNRQECTWLLKAKVGSYINLTSIHFDVEGYVESDCYAYDSVRIYEMLDGEEKIIGSYCNAKNPFDGVLSTGNELKIHFTSNWRNSFMGFKFRYSSVKPGYFSKIVYSFSKINVNY